jgi:electron transfer flavoprotein alpha subunit
VASERGILLYGELQENKLSSNTLELLSIGRRIASELNEELGIVFVGSRFDYDALLEATTFGADKVYVIDQPLLENYHTDAYVVVMAHVCRELEPNILVLSQTSTGRDLAPGLSFRLRTRLVTDCIDLKVNPQTGILLRTKPIYGGNAYATFVSEARPQMATMRAKSTPVAERDCSRKGEIVTLDVKLESNMIRTNVISRVDDKTGAGKKLETADVIVCGGRGLGSADNFTYLEELAALLKGAVGATRVPCDLGWVSEELQIGMTGKVVAPALYIGVALSGSSAHLAGCGNAKIIIAINKDPEANIFRVADYGIVGDFKEVLHVIMETIKK